MPSFGNAQAGAMARRLRLGIAAAAVMSTLLAGTLAAQDNAEKLFKEARAREALLRREIDARKGETDSILLLERVRTLIGAYGDIAQLFPRSTSSDDALWQGASLAADAFWDFGQASERTTALKMLKTLTTRFPASSFSRQAKEETDRLTSAQPSATLQASPVAPPPAALSPAARPAAALPPARPAATTATPSPRVAVALIAIRRESVPGALRVTLELGGEAAYRTELLDGPPRLLIDIDNTLPVQALKDASQSFPDDVVRQIRVGEQLGTKTRVVLDLTATPPQMTYALYNPYRVVIDFARPASSSREGSPPSRATAELRTPAPPVPARGNVSAPASPAVNTKGGFSLSRQLGLGIARVVIDPGHGGHDPGALNDGLSEAELVLDVALRLEKLLAKQPGVDVVMTRRSNVFVPLEERTAIANREGADLFLSIHANASEDDRVRGVETYFLNFAPNPAAEAIAARENAASARTMRQLPDIVKAIALNNKIDESRDFASLVHTSMMDRLRRWNRNVKNLGVKQAPFMVLIGATMPSVLSEVSFLTNRQESALLRGTSYRQLIAEALFNGIMKYQKSLKADAETASSQ